MFNKFKLEKENKELKDKLKIAYRLVAELNLRLGNNQKVHNYYFEEDKTDYDKDIIIQDAYASFDKIITTIKSEDYMNIKEA